MSLLPRRPWGGWIGPAAVASPRWSVPKSNGMGLHPQHFPGLMSSTPAFLFSRSFLATLASLPARPLVFSMRITPDVSNGERGGRPRVFGSVPSYNVLSRTVRAIGVYGGGLAGFSEEW